MNVTYRWSTRKSVDKCERPKESGMWYYNQFYVDSFYTCISHLYLLYIRYYIIYIIYSLPKIPLWGWLGRKQKKWEKKWKQRKDKQRQTTANKGKQSQNTDKVKSQNMWHSENLWFWCDFNEAKHWNNSLLNILSYKSSYISVFRKIRSKRHVR